MVDQDNENVLKNNILDFSIDNNERLEMFIVYYNIYDIDKTLELLNRLCGIYKFSGIKVLECFLYNLSIETNIESCLLRLEASKALFLFDELEEEFSKKDTEEIKKIKSEYNTCIQQRNKNRKIKAFDSLNIFCSSNIETLPTPCRIDTVFMLMESQELYKVNCDTYFRKIINDIKIDCYYRYKSILDLEKKKDIINYTNFYIKNSLFDFLNLKDNSTNYKILAAQYLLQHIKDITDDEKNNIQKIILSFAEDQELDYNLRADSADLLLHLGCEEYKIIGKNIISILGRIEGNVRTIYDNKQNVHIDIIEKSSLHILQFLSCTPVLKINNKEIDYNYVYNEIKNILKDQQFKSTELNVVKKMDSIKKIKDNYISDINCKNCESYIGYIYSNNNKCQTCIKYNEECYSKSIYDIFCNSKCEFQFEKHSKIYISLNRIELDRTLYNNNILSTITVKLWSYINQSEFKSEMIKRLLEELEDMSGTCSTGFLCRLLNTISGFGELNIFISFEDQLVANFIGRLNSYARKITHIDSIFYKERLYDVLELIGRNNSIFNNKTNENKKDIIDKYLLSDREIKIINAIEMFAENVINEMTVNSSRYNDKRHFSLFFISYLPKLRQELYEEFKEFIEDSIFDLTIRKAISTYEGLTDLI